MIIPIRVRRLFQTHPLGTLLPVALNYIFTAFIINAYKRVCVKFTDCKKKKKTNLIILLLTYPGYVSCVCFSLLAAVNLCRLQSPEIFGVVTCFIDTYDFYRDFLFVSVSKCCCRCLERVCHYLSLTENNK